jgi:putative ABC transport system ATP-binding protein
MTPLLDLDGIGRTYDDGHPVYALRPTTIQVSAGDYVTITGPSGSGKSTMLNLVGLLDTPSMGSYRVNGVETVGVGDRFKVAVRGQLFGFVFQSFHLLAGRSAIENVEIGMLYGPHNARTRHQRAAEALDRMRLGHRAHADPRTLSGGERQRVAIARAIAPRPEVLFCDEPTGNLDSANTDNMLALLDELHRDSLTVLVVTHDSHVAARGTRRLSVDDGVVVEARS